MSTIIERVSMLCEAKKISLRQLEKTIGAGNGMLSKAIQRGSGLSSDWLEKIVTYYKDISTEWLLLGKGEMFYKLPVNNDAASWHVLAQLVASNLELSQSNKIISEANLILAKGQDELVAMTKQNFNLGKLLTVEEVLHQKVKLPDAPVEILPLGRRSTTVKPGKEGHKK